MSKGCGIEVIRDKMLSEHQIGNTTVGKVVAHEKREIAERKQAMKEDRKLIKEVKKGNK